MQIKSGIIALSAAFSTFLAPFAVFAATAIQPQEKIETSKGYKEIHTEELKKLMDAKKTFLIFDARKKLSGGIIPGAKQLPYDADEKAIAKAVGSHPKDYMIIVYCTRQECPLSKYLAENLISAGYTNVYKYPEGVEAWMKNYPVDPVK